MYRAQSERIWRKTSLEFSKMWYFFHFWHPYPDHLMGIREGFCVAPVVAGQQERRCPLSGQPPTSWPPWPWSWSSSPSAPPWPPPSTTARTVARLPWRWGASRQLLFLYKLSLVLRWSFPGLWFRCNNNLPIHAHLVQEDASREKKLPMVKLLDFRSAKSK